MAIEALSEMPRQLSAGTTWKVERSYSDYPAGDGWVVTFYFVNASSTPFSVACTANGDAHLMEYAATSSAGVAAGIWFYEARAVKSGEKVLVESGQVEVKPDFTSLAAASDQRSHARKVLDAVEAVLEARASTAILETEINTGATTRRLKNMSHAELVALHSRYKYLVAKEERASRGRTNILYGRFPG